VLRLKIAAVWDPVFCSVVDVYRYLTGTSCLAYFSTVKEEAAHSSETSVHT
jgi:hypothetical protein